MLKTILITATLAAVPALAQAEPKQVGQASDIPVDQREKVAGVQPLLVKAIERGEAHGILVGPGAELLKKRFRTNSPALLDVYAISKLDRPDCRLLFVSNTQMGVWEPGAKQAKDKQVQYQVAFCKDGKPYGPQPQNR